MSRDLLRQPKAVWAVAFACVIAFMGIGLVDPILPALARELDASPSQVELLFTSYFAATGISMLVTGWVSSRIGPKRTLVAGLVLIVIFSAAAGASGSIGEIVAFRGVWGLGNAFFIATALAAIVGAASGGLAGAIVLYEAALGLGIASGPLLGGELGALSWRAPFFGTAVLMAIGLVAILILLDRTPAPAQATSIGAPLKALRHPGLRGLGLTALFYNFGFFILLAFTPFPLGLDAHGLGYVFFGWGLMVAVFSVFVAPWLAKQIGTVTALYLAFVLVALDLLVMAVETDSQTTLIVAVIAAGAFLGVVNTLLTHTVMWIAPVDRATTSASYSFVRFIGGAAAPYLAGKMAERWTPHVPFYVGAASVTVAIGVLAASRAHLRGVDESLGHEPRVVEPEPLVAVLGD